MQRARGWCGMVDAVGWWAAVDLVGARALPPCRCCFCIAAVVLRRCWPPLPQTAERTAAIGSALTHVGVGPRGRVGVYGANSPEWMIAMQVGWGWGGEWGGRQVTGAGPGTRLPPLLLMVTAHYWCYLWQPAAASPGHWSKTTAAVAAARSRLLLVAPPRGGGGGGSGTAGCGPWGAPPPPLGPGCRWFCPYATNLASTHLTRQPFHTPNLNPRLARTPCWGRSCRRGN